MMKVERPEDGGRRDMQMIQQGGKCMRGKDNGSERMGGETERVSLGLGIVIPIPKVEG